MDSKNIYIAYMHFSNNIEWKMHRETEWMYLGVGKEFREVEAVELVNSFFSENDIFFITDRHNSFMIGKSEAILKVKEYIAENDPVLANKDFSKMIEYNKIGVVRKGQRSL